jgi:hypothetical protein
VVLAPRIAADAAQAALEALTCNDPVKRAAAIEAVRRGGKPGPGRGGGAGVAQPDMDLDGGSDSPPQAPPTPPDLSRPVMPEQTLAAAVVALATASTRAKLIADAHALEMEQLTQQIVRAQLKRVRIKLKYLQQIEEVGAAIGVQ